MKGCLTPDDLTRLIAATNASIDSQIIPIYSPFLAFVDQVFPFHLPFEVGSGSPFLLE